MEEALLGEWAFLAACGILMALDFLIGLTFEKCALSLNGSIFHGWEYCRLLPAHFGSLRLNDGCACKKNQWRVARV